MTTLDKRKRRKIMEKKEIYTAPEMEIIYLEHADIITESPGDISTYEDETDLVK